MATDAMPDRPKPIGDLLQVIVLVMFRAILVEQIECVTKPRRHS
jgi:hypothetical protein